MPTQIPLHKALAEAVVNTLKVEKVEVPNTNGAKMVRLDSVLIEIDAPEGIAATATEVKASVSVGDCEAAITAAAAIIASTPGVSAEIHARMYGAGSCIMDTSKEYHPNRMVPATPDGKHYITVAVKGANNVAVKTARVSATFTLL